MDRALFLRAAGIQAGLVIAVSLILAILLPKSFFEDWGWVSGPIAWGVCALATARILGLVPFRALVGAGLAGIPSMVAVLAGVHWLGIALAIAFFGAWCGSGRAGLPTGSAPLDPASEPG